MQKRNRNPFWAWMYQLQNYPFSEFPRLPSGYVCICRAKALGSHEYMFRTINCRDGACELQRGLVVTMTEVKEGDLWGATGDVCKSRIWKGSLCEEMEWYVCSGACGICIRPLNDNRRILHCKPCIGSSLVPGWQTLCLVTNNCWSLSEPSSQERR